MRTARLISLALLAVLLAPSAAHGGSTDLVISQVFAGGGNVGAPYANDYVELFNRGSSTVDLTGWTVQYATATGTSWTATPLAGSLSPGRRYLVQFASGGAAGGALPAPDATDTTNLAASGGKVAVVHATSALACGAAPGSCSSVAALHDLVGYGAATDYETAPAPAPSNTTALTRAGGGCTDTDADAADFTAETPAPRNSTAAATTCGGGSAGSGTPSTQSAAVTVDVQSSISLSLERSSVSFGSVAPGDLPAAVSERVTVTSTDTAGYALTARRTPFTPADLPLGVTASAAPGTQLAAPLAGGAVVALPSTTDLLLGTSAARSAAGGDAWPTSLAFASPIPAVAPGRYSATVVYTVIGGTIT
jgi:hypothetical protein